MEKQDFKFFLFSTENYGFLIKDKVYYVNFAKELN